jgi:hypothetical protein
MDRSISIWLWAATAVVEPGVILEEPVAPEAQVVWAALAAMETMVLLATAAWVGTLVAVALVEQAILVEPVAPEVAAARERVVASTSTAAALTLSRTR